MEGLPLLPGYSFHDPTQTKYHVSHVFEYKNGYAVPKRQPLGIGKKPLDVSSMAFIKQTDPLRYDPSLTYGRTKAAVLPTFRPHFLLYDKKCLTFFAFFRQTVNDSPNEHYRIRQVNIIYFLEDDSITVMEPVIRDAGFPQGRLIKRSKIPKSDAGDFYHWKDFNVGMDIAMFGTVYHICSCDGYTREYLMSQGVELNEDEELPFDPYIRNRQLSQIPSTNRTPSTSEDKLRRFLEYDGKVLRFYIAWDDRESEYGELRPFIMHYYLATDFVDVCEVKQPNSGRDPYPMLLNKMKLPKNWKDMPANYPAAYLEKGDHEIVEYYQPKDLIIGNTVFLMARRFIIYDCDQFTRNYYFNCLNITQPDPIQIPFSEKKKKRPVPKPQPPPHIGFGSPDDSIQSCYSVVPKPTKKDVLKYIINFGKKLRYTAKLIAVHPEDEGREFIFEYNLADSKILVQELTKQNSGFIGGRFLSPILLPKPGSDISNPDYYTPVDFYIGAVINVYGHKFEITGADLKVYRYMEQNPEKFTTEFINDFRNHFMRLGLLNDDVTKRVELDMRKNDCYEPVNADVNKASESVNDNILGSGGT